MLSFYHLPNAERCQRTASALKARITLLERWETLEAEGPDRWARRAKMTANWLSEANISSVLDLGCGTMTLERALPSSVRYLPCDVVRRDDRTILCNLNRTAAPALDADAVTCLGLIDYLFDPAALLTDLARRHRVCVLSYNIADALEDISIRRCHAWFNDFSRGELEAVFGRAGWCIDRAERFGPTQMLWRLRA
jgi:hypothetical protein